MFSDFVFVFDFWIKFQKIRVWFSCGFVRITLQVVLIDWGEGFLLYGLFGTVFVLAFMRRE